MLGFNLMQCQSRDYVCYFIIDGKVFVTQFPRKVEPVITFGFNFSFLEQHARRRLICGGYSGVKV